MTDHVEQAVFGRRFDVTNIADDFEALRTSFIEVSNCDSEVRISGWIDTEFVHVYGPYEHTGAIVYKLRSDTGSIRFFSQTAPVWDELVGPEAEDKIILSLLPPAHTCWVVGKNSTKIVECLK